MKKTARIGLAILVLLFCFNRAAKADFASAFNAGIKAYPPNAKLGGLGGAWSASPSPDGNNPAALATLRNYRLRGAINSDYSFINFDQGPDINVFIIDGLTVLGKGVLRVDYCNFFPIMRKRI